MPQILKDWSEFGEYPEPEEGLKSGDLRASLSGFAMQHLLDYRRRTNSDSPAIGFGTTLWLLGDYSGGAMVWAKVCDDVLKNRYTHSSNGTFQSGLLLRFASTWLRDEDWRDKSDELLDKLLRKKRPVMGATFAIRLARLLRREIDLAQIEAGYSEVSLLREREQTMALFYAGVRAFEEGDISETQRLWKQVVEPKNKLVELEYYLLVCERGRLSREAQPAT